MVDSQAFNQSICQQLLAGTPIAWAKTYVLYGQTPFLSEENAQTIVRAARQQGFSQREILYVSARTKPQDILSPIQSPGLFDAKKIVELRFENEKVSKKIGEQLLTLSQHQSPNLVIIQAGNLSYKTQKEGWFSQLISHSQAVAARAIYADQFPNWIHQRAEQLNVSLTNEALKCISRFSEGNLLWCQQVLMQLHHSDYARPIEAHIVNDVLTDMSIFAIDDLSRTLLEKNSNALLVAKKLERENTSLVYINASLYRDFDILYRLQQSTKPFTEAAKALNIWQSKQKRYRTALEHFSGEKIRTTIKQLAELDRINKGQSKGDGWLLLNQVISHLLEKAP